MADSGANRAKRRIVGLLGIYGLVALAGAAAHVAGRLP